MELSVRFVKDTDIDFSKADISTNPGYKVLCGYRYEADVLLQEFSLSSSFLIVITKVFIRVIKTYSLAPTVQAFPDL